MVIDKDCVLQTPLWYHNELQLQTIPQWSRRSKDHRGSVESKLEDDYYTK